MKTGKLIFRWHHWSGLIVGIFLLIMSLSGAMLAFTDEIEAGYESKWLTIQNPNGDFSFDPSIHKIRDLYHGWEIRIYDQPSKNEALVYDLRKGNEIKKIFVHPVSGVLLHVEENVQQQLHRVLLNLHYTLFAGTIGKITVFFVGILFLISLVTGIYIYRRAIVKGLLFRIHINRKTKRSFYSSIHRAIGVWSIFFNILIVSTGLLISGNIALAALKATPNTKTPVRSEIGSVDSINNILAKDQPGFRVYLVRIAANSNVIQFSGNFKGDPFYYGKYYSRFYYDGLTGQLQKTELLKDQPGFKKIQSIAGPLHFGNYGGLPIKILYCILGLMPAILSISGFIIWWIKGRATN